MASIIGCPCQLLTRRKTLIKAKTPYGRQDDKLNPAILQNDGHSAQKSEFEGFLFVLQAVCPTPFSLFFNVIVCRGDGVKILYPTNFLPTCATLTGFANTIKFCLVVVSSGSETPNSAQIRQIEFQNPRLNEA